MCPDVQAALLGGISGGVVGGVLAIIGTLVGLSYERRQRHRGIPIGCVLPPGAGPFGSGYYSLGLIACPKSAGPQLKERHLT